MMYMNIYEWIKVSIAMVAHMLVKNLGNVQTRTIIAILVIAVSITGTTVSAQDRPAPITNITIIGDSTVSYSGYSSSNSGSDGRITGDTTPEANIVKQKNHVQLPKREIKERAVASAPNIFPGDGGDYGIWITENTDRITGVYASQSVTPSMSLPQAVQPTLYAPTLMPPGYSPVEVVTTYWNYSGMDQTARAFGIWNHGSINGWAVLKYMDSNFLYNYVRYYPEGELYFVEILKSGSSWSVLLYNFNTNLWEVQYQTEDMQTINRVDGWDIFEKYFGNECLTIPKTTSSNLMALDNGVWTSLTPYGVLLDYNTCNYLEIMNPYYAWSVSMPEPVHNINKGTNYATIQDAIDNASPGDEIHVDSGTYYENVNVNKRLTLRGIGMPVVDAMGSGSAITLVADGITLEGFSATGAGYYPDKGAGINVLSNDNVLIGNNASSIICENTEDFDFCDGSIGISLSSSSNNSLIGNNVDNNVIGIFLDDSSNNTMISNTANSNWGYYFDNPCFGTGISLYFSSNNILTENTANSNCEDGISLTSSNNNTLRGNNANGNGGYFTSATGIFLSSSSNNTLISNNANLNDGELNSYGISLDYSNNNTLSGNNANGNFNEWGYGESIGIRLSSSINNKIYHNNLIDNTNQAYDDSNNNLWDNGYPSSGNYWSDYTGTDSNNDGIGDTPYSISGDAGAQDRYPLIKRIGSIRINVTSPKGGENWERGKVHSITWNYSGGTGTNVKIELLKNGVVNRLITSSTSIGSSGSGSYNWLINSIQTLGTDYKIRITSTTDSEYSDTSNISFTVSALTSINLIKNPGFESLTSNWIFNTNGAGTFTAASPGFEGTKTAKIVLGIGDTNTQLYQTGIILEENRRYRLSFSSYSTTGNDMRIILHKHGSPYTVYGLNQTFDIGTNWQNFMTEFTTENFIGTVNDVRFRFHLSPFAKAGDTYYIDNVFLEKVSSITVTSPNGGENLTRGKTHLINWTSTGSPGTYVKIELLKPGVANKVIISSTPNDGTHPWPILVTQAPGTDYRIKVTSTSNAAYTDTSDNTFTIPTPTIAVISPNGSESWIRGTTQTIKWNSTGVPGTYVKIELLKAGKLNRTIISSTPNDGSHPWLILGTQAPGTDYKIRITSTSNASYNDTSDNSFTIPVPSITVVYPNGSETWTRGTTQTIRWNSTESPKSYVKIELLKPGLANKVITSSTINDGTHPWLMPAAQTPGTDYQAKITSTANISVNDISDNNFTIPVPSMTVVSPNGSENWTQGTTQTIKWNSTESPKSYVKIELIKPGMANKVLIASTLNDGANPWLIPATQVLGTDYRIKITSTINASINDMSDNNFNIVPPKITVTSPNGGQTWLRGKAYPITWNYTGRPGTYVKIELLKNGLLNRTILASTPNDKVQSWTIPTGQAPGTDYRVRITSTTNAGYNDTSDGNFNIIIP